MLYSYLGLINLWIQQEQDLVAQRAKEGSKYHNSLQTNTCVYFHSDIYEFEDIKNVGSIHMNSLPGFSRGETTPLSLENMQPVFAVGQQPPILFLLKHFKTLHIFYTYKNFITHFWIWYYYLYIIYHCESNVSF